MPKKAVKVFLTEEERRMLIHVAQAVGEDLSSYIRYLILAHLNNIGLVKERILFVAKVSDRT